MDWSDGKAVTVSVNAQSVEAMSAVPPCQLLRMEPRSAPSYEAFLTTRACSKFETDCCTLS